MKVIYMKKALFITLVMSTVFLGCDKFKDSIVVNKDIEYNSSLDVEGVPGMPDSITELPNGGVNADFPKVTNATNSAQYMEDYNTSSDLISSLIVSKMSLDMSQPEGQNFDYLDTVRVYVSATGLDEKLLGHKYGIPKGTKLLDLDRSDMSLKEYFLKDSIHFRISAHFIDIPMDGAKMELKTVFSLVANPLK